MEKEREEWYQKSMITESLAYVTPDETVSFEGYMQGVKEYDKPKFRYLHQMFLAIYRFMKMKYVPVVG